MRDSGAGLLAPQCQAVMLPDGERRERLYARDCHVDSTPKSQLRETKIDCVSSAHNHRCFVRLVLLSSSAA